MRKLIFTLLMSLLVFGYSQAQVIFDPATHTGELPTGASIVTIDGVKYLKCPLNGWETSFAVPAVTLGANITKFKATAMFKEGTSGFTLSQVLSFIKLVDNSTSGWAEAALIKEASTAEVSNYSSDILIPEATITNVQLAGQNKVDWDGVVGDTLFVGAIIAYDPHLIFDPAMYAEGQFQGSDAMNIVTIEGEKYLKVELAGWNSVFQVSSTILEDDYNMFSAVAKYEVGTSGFALDNINTFVQLAHGDPWATFGKIEATSSATFTEYSADITTQGGDVTAIQVAGQEKTNWTELTGDFLYLGKVTAYKYDNTVLFDPATFTGELTSGMEIVDIEGTKYLKVTSEDSWTHTLAIDDYNTDIYNTVITNIKWAAGTSGLTAEHAQTVVNIQTAGVEGNVAEIKLRPSPTDFTDVDAMITPATTVNTLQFFVQQDEGSWPTVAGAEIYLGKIIASFVELEPVTPPNTTDIVFTELTVDVNGLYDDAYDNSTENLINRVALGSVDGVAAAEGVEVDENSDSYAYWYSVFDLDNFYIYIDVNDNDPVDLGTSESPWNNDGVEVFIDIKDRRYVGWDRIDGQQHQFRFNVGTEGPAHGSDDDAGITALGMPNFFGVNDTTNIQYAIVKGSNGYAIEMAIPWATFFRTSAQDDNKQAVADAATGVFNNKKIAFEVSLLDASAVDVRKSIMNWANNTGEDKAYETTEFWGQVSLKGGPEGILNKIATRSLSVYPNPADNYLNIAMNNLDKVEVYNILGAQVLNTKMNHSNWLDVSSLKTGVYIVKATDAKGKIAIAKFNKK
ncbi:MAG: hypothetical protein CVU09_05205 [Bacteroidetes bacterium HGW-Bacteroidetes-4]|jgi:hypothetical protein|nr:MAG: hypothetical protein CVU09_05205 [Bacteroidetes bacterium HGW-Bacteroidetes-4]